MSRPTACGCATSQTWRGPAGRSFSAYVRGVVASVCHRPEGKTATATVNLDAQRIHWSGVRDPTLETLAGLIEAHTAHIPFENLDVFLGRAVRLDLDGLQSKIVGARRGGYCFELRLCSPPCLMRSVFRSPVMPRVSFCLGHWP